MLRFTGLEISCPQHPGTEKKIKKKIKRIRKAKTEDLHCHADLKRKKKRIRKKKWQESATVHYGVLGGWWLCCHTAVFLVWILQQHIGFRWIEFIPGTSTKHFSNRHRWKRIIKNFSYIALFSVNVNYIHIDATLGKINYIIWFNKFYKPIGKIRLIVGMHLLFFFFIIILTDCLSNLNFPILSVLDFVSM